MPLTLIRRRFGERRLARGPRSVAARLRMVRLPSPQETWPVAQRATCPVLHHPPQQSLRLKANLWLQRPTPNNNSLGN